MVVTGKPSEIPIAPLKPAVSVAAPVQRGPSYNDAFAQFLQQSNKAPKPKPIPQASPPQTESQPASVIKETPKSNRGRKKKEVIPEVQSNQPAPSNNQTQNQQQQIQYQQQQPIQNQSNVIAQNQRVKTERIPQSQPMYAIQENTVLTQDGKQQKLYYTILNTPNSGPNIQQQLKMNPQYGLYGQQSF